MGESLCGTSAPSPVTSLVGVRSSILNPSKDIHHSATTVTFIVI